MAVFAFYLIIVQRSGFGVFAFRFNIVSLPMPRTYD